jgi:hypothetical protein
MPVDVRLRNSNGSEQDAMALLHTLGNCYEPVRLFPRLPRKDKADDDD